MMRCFLAIFLFFGSTIANAVEEKSSNKSSDSQIGIRVDCLNNFNLDKGESQDCFEISGLRFDHTQALSDKLEAYLRLDPYGTPISDRAHLPLRAGTPRLSDESIATIVDHYSFRWSPRPNLRVAIEEFGGSAKIPSVSGLATAAPFQNSGWDQTAITLTYNLAALEGMKVTFAAGNGEGENGANLDPQQYFGFGARGAIINGLNAHIGVSLDGNSVGSDEYEWMWSQYSTDCLGNISKTSKQGYSTQRLAVGLEMDGKMAGTNGLKAGLGFQRNILSDLSKSNDAYLSADELSNCGPVNLDHFFVEDSTNDQVNTVQKTIISLNLNYPISSTYFVGLDYQQRRIDTGTVELFQICEGFDGTTCSVPGESKNNLSQDSLSVGGGIELAEGLMWTLEYNTTSYDKDYVNAYYVGRSSKATDTWESFASRFAYNWK